jgi:hypothetical protein
MSAPMNVLEFEWSRCRDGYRIRAQPKPRSRESALIIESASANYELYRPTEFPALFQVFADAPSTPEGILDFTNKYGGLGSGGLPLFMHTDFKSEEIFIDEALLRQEHLRRAIALADVGDWDALAELYNSDYGPFPMRGAIRTKLRPKPHAKPELVYEPTSLGQFLWLQFGQYVTADAKLLRCECCKTPFLVGPGTGRRDTAKFCSNACKAADFRSRRNTANA